MKQTLLCRLFLLLLALPSSLAAMSESEMIEGCNKLDKELLERKERIKQLEVSLKDTDTIVTILFHEGREHKKIVGLQDPEHKKAVKKYKDHLNKQIECLEWHSKTIEHLCSMIEMVKEKLPKEQIDHLRTSLYVKSLHDQRDEYEKLLKSVSKDKELYEKDYLMKAMPAESLSELKNDN